MLSFENHNDYYSGSISLTTFLQRTSFRCFLQTSTYALLSVNSRVLLCHAGGDIYCFYLQRIYSSLFHNKTPLFPFANCSSTSQWECHSWFHGEQVSLSQTPGHSYWFGVDGPPYESHQSHLTLSIVVTQIGEMISSDT